MDVDFNIAIPDFMSAANISGTGNHTEMWNKANGESANNNSWGNASDNNKDDDNREGANNNSWDGAGDNNEDDDNGKDIGGIGTQKE